jgi:hypothetical protein
MTAARVLFMFRLFKSQRDVRQFQHPLAVRRPAGRFSQARSMRAFRAIRRRDPKLVFQRAFDSICA